MVLIWPIIYIGKAGYWLLPFSFLLFLPSGPPEHFGGWVKDHRSAGLGVIQSWPLWWVGSKVRGLQGWVWSSPGHFGGLGQRSKVSKAGCDPVLAILEGWVKGRRSAGLGVIKSSYRRRLSGLFLPSGHLATGLQMVESYQRLRPACWPSGHLITGLQMV